MPLSQLQQVIAHYRAQLATREQTALQTLSDVHAKTVRIIDGDMQVLYRAIEARLASGQEIPVEWVLEHYRLYSIEQMISGKINDYGTYARHVTTFLQSEGVLTGSAAAQALLQASLPTGVAFSFGVPSQSALQAFIGATQAGSPLSDLFAGFGAEAAQSVKETLLTGLTLGHGPRDVAEAVAQDLQVSYNRAATIARNELNRAYKGAAVENYRANSDVVEQWRWTCAFSPRTCAACFAMDGSLHDLSEDMESHVCCRCTPVPVTKSWSDLLDGVDLSGLDDSSVTDDIQSGADWFASQSADVQQQVLGKQGYQLYANGTPLKDFVGISHDKTWGKSIYQRSIKEVMKRPVR